MRDADKMRALISKAVMTRVTDPEASEKAINDAVDFFKLTATQRDRLETVATMESERANGNLRAMRKLRDELTEAVKESRYWHEEYRLDAEAAEQLRDKLEARIKELEGQVADLNGKVQKQRDDAHWWRAEFHRETEAGIKAGLDYREEIRALRAQVASLQDDLRATTMSLGGALFKAAVCSGNAQIAEKKYTAEITTLTRELAATKERAALERHDLVGYIKTRDAQYFAILREHGEVVKSRDYYSKEYMRAEQRAEELHAILGFVAHCNEMYGEINGHLASRIAERAAQVDALQRTIEYLLAEIAGEHTEVSDGH